MSGVRESLSSVPENEYGADYRAHCMDIYRLCVEEASAISDRRSTANSFFLTINTAILGAAGYIGGTNAFPVIALAVAGCILCIIWWRLILSYKGLNTGKFAVILEIEKQLPLAPFGAEWIAVGEGKDKKKYWPFTKVEVFTPWVFFGLHTVLLIYSQCKAGPYTDI